MKRAALGLVVAGALSAQTVEPAGAGALSRGLDAENGNRAREAVTAYREAIAAGAVVQGVLGLERVFSLTMQEDSVLAVLDTLLPRFPDDGALRGVQLRALVSLGRSRAADAAFHAWRDARPDDLVPYRDYARILLFNNRAAAADTVLRDAATALGSLQGLTLELAQMRAGLGRWEEAALAWRAVVQEEAYYESAAVFSLTPTPVAARALVRAALLAGSGAASSATSAAPPTIGVRQVRAFLEVAWGSPRDGWTALSAVPVSDTAVAVWRQFGEEVERAQAWGVARDAWSAVHRARPDAVVAWRGAQAALRAGDAATALALVRGAGAGDSTARVDVAVPLELEALARLGRGAEVTARLAAESAALGPDRVRSMQRVVAWAWIRAGDVPRARAALAGATLDAEDEVAGWLALYEGELAAARQALRHVTTPDQDVVRALALLNRTTAPRAPAVGAAFLALGRADTTDAVRRFESAAADLPDAAPVLLAMAARLETGRGADGRARRLWQRVATEHAAAPEAAEAQLEWARGLRRAGDGDGAREHLEHLILTYPGSALVPQARRELDALRPQVAS
ncbi:MAG: hypothetical protein P3A32_06285 [Gemmatimonadota bacterium]|nr:hypothetical protein [Gemmatimonadota bacterium]MDQ8147777.1 hypothetical protein [Gemmatimonadota bacterium]MDQ8149416.1 hypothetical protein [Gemmatimonadota bacterium]MDQ8157174.1 hypothetical protein [Gemmatimonadota bacterium]MDQ8177098.1 hypothetical protein [Gemmatimonadota bacterium]